MKNKNGGFTLVELFAVILIASTILIPLLSGYINNFTANNRMHDRKAASSIALSTVDAFDKIYYENFRNMIYQEDVDGTFDDIRVEYDDGEIHERMVRVDGNDCSFFTENSRAMLGVATSEEICGYIFDFSFANIQFDTNQFEVYLYSQAMTSEERDAILNNDNIPQRVRNEFNNVPTTENPGQNTTITRITVRVLYDGERGDDYVASGVISEGFEQEVFVDDDEEDE